MPDGANSHPVVSGSALANRIYEIGFLLTSSGEPNTVIRAIVERILNDTGSHYVGIALLDNDQEYVYHAWGLMADGEWFPPSHRHALGTGLVGQSIAQGKTICAPEVSRHKGYVHLFEGIRSELVVPLRLGDTIIGALDAESRHANWFGDDEIQVLESISTPVALAIHNARLFDNAKRRADQLSLLNRVGAIITSTLEPEELMNRVVTEIREQTGYNFVGLALVDQARQRAVLTAFSTKTPVSLALGHSQGRGEGIVGQVLETGRSIIANDLSEFPDHVPTGPSLRSEMSCPLKVGDRIIGILDAESTEAMAFGKTDLLVFEALGDYIAQALENAANLATLARMREDLSHMLVHDLRSPLTVITSALSYVAADLARGGAATHEKSRGYLQAAVGSCDQIAMMIDSLIELQRMESRQLVLKVQETSLADLVREVTGHISLTRNADQLEISADVKEDLPLAPIDRSLVTRVLENLLNNAVKFSPPDARIHLTLDTRDNGDFLLSVADTGPGIRPEETGLIFEKLYTTNHPRKGYGLGLAFCKHAVEAHGGHIWVESDGRTGSTFKLTLPCG